MDNFVELLFFKLTSMKKTILLFFVLAFIFSSCIVSKKKFDDMLAQKIRTEGELADKSKKLDEASTSISQLNESLKKLKQDSVTLTQSLQSGNKRFTDLNSEYEKLNANYKTSLTKSGKLSQDLTQQRDQ